MAAYLKKVMTFLLNFEKFELVSILHNENSHADALSKLANSRDSELLVVVPIEHLLRPSISKEQEVMWVETPHGWAPSLRSYKTTFYPLIKRRQEN